jgi:hypothetical protein
VQRLPLDFFLSCHGERGRLRRAQYGADAVSCAVKLGAQYAETALRPDETLALALAAVEVGDHMWVDGRYHFMANNCEAFACYCKTGQRPMVSRQVARGVAIAGLVAMGGAAAVCSSSSLAAAGAASAGIIRSRASRFLVSTAPVVLASMVVAEAEQKVLGWGVKRLKSAMFG